MHVAPEVGEVGVTEEPTTEKVEFTEKENKDDEMLDRDQWQPSRNMSKEVSSACWFDVGPASKTVDQP